MIQFNLLPDVKLEYIKAQSMRRLILGVSVLISVIAIVILGLLIGANQLGKKHLSDLSRDIATESHKLQNEPQINNILTVQNQLESLTTLHGGKPALSRTFDYLNSLTPAHISITSYVTDLTANTVIITGTSDSLSTVNQYVDTLKFTTYMVTDTSTAAGATTTTKPPAFSNVVLSSFGLVSGSKADQAASFSVSLKYDPVIYDITKTVSLTVPNLVTTRSGNAQPSDLFSATPTQAATPATTPAATSKTTSGGTR
jgi:Tfp pilus assembly protein PilN